MSKNDKWDELQKRWTLGEPLTPSEDATRRVLASQDAPARRELAIYDELKRQVALSSDEEAPREFVNRVLEAAGLRTPTHLRLVSPDELPPEPLPEPEPVRRLPRTGLFMGAVATLATAAAAFVMLAPEADTTQTESVNTPQPPEQIAPAALEPARSELVFTSGTVTVNGEEVEPGQKTLTGGERVATHAGRACFTIDPEIDVCLADKSEVVIDSLAEHDVRVKVLRGEAVAALPPRQANHELSLTAEGLSATARGTVFALSRSATGEANVTVVEGKVEVVDARRQRALLKAHSRASVKRDEPIQKERVGRTEEGQLLSLLGPRELWQERELGVLALQGNPGVQVMIDDEGPFALPVSSFVAPGKHRISVREGNGDRTVEVDVVAGKVKEVVLTAGTRASNKKKKAAAAPETTSETPASLLAKARSALKQGDTGTALTAYRDLHRSFPSSAEAATVLVTVGKLELRQNAPGRALAAFDSYLGRGGPLRPEALAGRVRALRALGRTADERRAIESYLASYPKGFEAMALKKRLSVLSR
jgi:hypothetical protein